MAMIVAAIYWICGCHYTASSIQRSMNATLENQNKEQNVRRNRLIHLPGEIKKPKGDIAVCFTFAIVTVCCSMTSWVATLSESFILSNSSIHTTPLSARTIAPACSRGKVWFKRLLRGQGTLLRAFFHHFLGQWLLQQLDRHQKILVR